jgi:hypothetical protein
MAPRTLEAIERDILSLLPKRAEPTGGVRDAGVAPPARFPVNGNGPSRLERAWSALTLEGIAELLNRYTAGEWHILGDGKRIEGPCPAGRGKCAKERGSAYVYPRTDAGPPFVHCSHRSTCGAVTSVYEIVLAQHSSPMEAVRAIMLAAGIEEEDHELDLATLEAQLGPPFVLARGGEPLPLAPAARETIIVTDNIAQMCDALETVLVSANAGLYQNGKAIARVVCAGEKTRLEPMPLASLNAIASRYARFAKRVLNQNGDRVEKPTFPPKQVIEALYSAGSWQFNELDGIALTPTLLPTGELIAEPGYSARGKLFYVPGTKFPEIPSNPTIEDAKDAFAILAEPVCDFPFVAESDRSAWMALVLTMLARMTLEGPTPLFLIRASAAGTGKNLLADLAALIATGQDATVLEAVDDAAEWRKQITTAVLSGSPFVVLDEAEVLSSKALASALTLRWWLDRVLGSNKEVRVLRPVFATCGNNTTMRGDMARRCVPIDIYSLEERPQERDKWRYPNVKAWTRENRGTLLVAALTILRAFFLAGRPRQSITAYGSFECWSDIVRSALVWVGAPDPCLGRERLREESDQGLDELRTLLGVWFSKQRDEWRTVADLVRAAGLDEELMDALEPLGGHKSMLKTLDSRKLGYALRRVRGRVVGGLRLESEPGGTGGFTRWRVFAIRDPAATSF